MFTLQYLNAAILIRYISVILLIIKTFQLNNTICLLNVQLFCSAWKTYDAKPMLRNKMMWDVFDSER